MKHFDERLKNVLHCTMDKLQQDKILVEFSTLEMVMRLPCIYIVARKNGLT
jgi:hypothetical protein